MNKKLLALYGLKYNPFSPELPTEALLTKLGVLHASGHEHFNGSLVIPVIDTQGDRKNGSSAEFVGLQRTKSTVTD